MKIVTVPTGIRILTKASIKKMKKWVGLAKWKVELSRDLNGTRKAVPCPANSKQVKKYILIQSVLVQQNPEPLREIKESYSREGLLTF